MPCFYLGYVNDALNMDVNNNTENTLEVVF